MLLNHFSSLLAYFFYFQRFWVLCILLAVNNNKTEGKKSFDPTTITVAEQNAVHILGKKIFSEREIPTPEEFNRAIKDPLSKIKYYSAFILNLLIILSLEVFMIYYVGKFIRTYTLLENALERQSAKSLCFFFLTLLLGWKFFYYSFSHFLPSYHKTYIETLYNSYYYKLGLFNIEAPYPKENLSRPEQERLKAKHLLYYYYTKKIYYIMIQLGPKSFMDDHNMCSLADLLISYAPEEEMQEIIDWVNKVNTLSQKDQSKQTISTEKIIDIDHLVSKKKRKEEAKKKSKDREEKQPDSLSTQQHPLLCVEKQPELDPLQLHKLLYQNSQSSSYKDPCFLFLILASCLVISVAFETNWLLTPFVKDNNGHYNFFGWLFFFIVPWIIILVSISQLYSNHHWGVYRIAKGLENYIQKINRISKFKDKLYHTTESYQEEIYSLIFLRYLYAKEILEFITIHPLILNGLQKNDPFHERKNQKKKKRKEAEKARQINSLFQEEKVSFFQKKKEEEEEEEEELPQIEDITALVRDVYNYLSIYASEEQATEFLENMIDFLEQANYHNDQSSFSKDYIHTMTKIIFYGIKSLLLNDASENPFSTSAFHSFNPINSLIKDIRLIKPK